MLNADTLGHLVRWYALAQPRLLHALQQASQGHHPAALVAELYAGAKNRPTPMAVVVELEPGAEPPQPAPVRPVPAPAEGPAHYGIDPDRFTCAWYLVHEATLEGTLEAAHAGENPAVLVAELYDHGMTRPDERVRVVLVPVDPPPLVLELGALTAT